MSEKSRREALDTFDDFLQETLQEDEEFAGRWQVKGGLARFGARVRRVRVERGLSQEELAEMVGTGQPNISRIEHAATSPTYTTMAKIAQVLDVEFTIPPRPNEPEIEQVVVPIDTRMSREISDVREGRESPPRGKPWKRPSGAGESRLDAAVGGDDESSEKTALAS